MTNTQNCDNRTTKQQNEARRRTSGSSTAVATAPSTVSTTTMIVPLGCMCSPRYSVSASQTNPRQQAARIGSRLSSCLLLLLAFMGTPAVAKNMIPRPYSIANPNPKSPVQFSTEYGSQSNGDDGVEHFDVYSPVIKTRCRCLCAWVWRGQTSRFSERERRLRW